MPYLETPERTEDAAYQEQEATPQSNRAYLHACYDLPWATLDKLTDDTIHCILCDLDAADEQPL